MKSWHFTKNFYTWFNPRFFAIIKIVTPCWPIEFAKYATLDLISNTSFVNLVWILVSEFLRWVLVWYIYNLDIFLTSSFIPSSHTEHNDVCTYIPTCFHTIRSWPCTSTRIWMQLVVDTYSKKKWVLFPFLHIWKPTGRLQQTSNDYSWKITIHNTWTHRLDQFQQTTAKCTK